MIKKSFFKKIVTLCLIGCLLSSITVSAHSNSENNSNTTNDCIESIFTNISRIEETEEGTLYYFGEPEGTVLKTVDNNSTMLKVEEEGRTDNIIEIDKDNNVYLNGRQVVVTYENLKSENENAIAPRLTTRYYESDSGNPSLYTVLGKTEKVANIHFQSAIGSLTATVILGIIGFIVPGIGFTASVATAVASAFSAYNTKNLSCIVRHYYRAGWPGGWYMGSFAEKIVTTWYPQVDFKGNTTTTTHYRTGISY